MKLDRRVLREMILREMMELTEGSPIDTARNLVQEYGKDVLAGMLDVEVENLVYDHMLESGLMDDNWDSYLDAVMEALVGMEIVTEDVTRDIKRMRQRQRGHISGAEPVRPDPTVLRRWLSDRIPQGRADAVGLVKDPAALQKLNKDARMEYPQFDSDEIKKSVIAVVMSRR